MTFLNHILMSTHAALRPRHYTRPPRWRPRNIHDMCPSKCPRSTPTQRQPRDVRRKRSHLAAARTTSAAPPFPPAPARNPLSPNAPPHASWKNLASWPVGPVPADSQMPACFCGFGVKHSLSQQEITSSVMCMRTHCAAKM